MKGFQDITEIVREMKLQVDYGYYSDGWMDEHASLTVMAGETGVIDLEVVYPGIMSGGEAVRITMDKEEPLLSAGAVQCCKYNHSGRAVADGAPDL